MSTHKRVRVLVCLNIKVVFIIFSLHDQHMIETEDVLDF